LGKLQSFAGPAIVCGFFFLAYATARVFWPYSQPPTDTVGYLLLTRPCGTGSQAKWLALKAYSPNGRDERAGFFYATTEYSPRICSVGAQTPTSAAESSIVIDEHSLYIEENAPVDLTGYMLLTRACRTAAGYDQAEWLAIKAYQQNSENQADTFIDDVMVYWPQICTRGSTTPDRAVTNSALFP
jgi:hypothetical protein